MSEKDAYELLKTATCYLRAADVIVRSSDYREKHRVFTKPVGQVLGIGLELMFKYNLVYGGRSLDWVASKMGHDLVKMWNRRENLAIRHLAHEAAILSYASAANSGVYADAFTDKPGELLEEYIAALSAVYSTHALRYIPKEDDFAPAPRLLVDVFGGLLDRYIGNPVWLRNENLRFL